MTTEMLDCAPPPSSLSERVHPATRWKELHERYVPRIKRQIRRALGPDDEFEDIVQEVLIVVFQKHETLRNPACLDRWVAQVTINSLRYLMRRRRFRRHTSLENVPPERAPATRLDVDARNLASRAMGVLARMPADERSLLISYWFSPATADSIAVDTNSSVPTVRRRLLRARLRFEKLARQDTELAGCLNDARTFSRRWRYFASSKEGESRPPSMHRQCEWRFRASSSLAER